LPLLIGLTLSSPEIWQEASAAGQQRKSAVAYLSPILAEREPVERQQLYVSEIASSALSIEAQLIP
jgi:hypothetical protein